MYKRLSLLILTLFFAGQANSQELPKKEKVTPVFAIKSNLLYDATTSMNLGVEFKVGQKLTLDVPVTYNPWTFDNNKKFKHILVQPELRWWSCEPFSGHFFGLHTHYGNYNVGGIGSDYMKKHRFEGWLVGAGVSWGYHIYLGSRWNLGVNLGIGYAYLDYDKYNCDKCGDFIKKDTYNYFGVTKAGVSLIFLIK